MLVDQKKSGGTCDCECTLYSEKNSSRLLASNSGNAEKITRIENFLAQIFDSDAMPVFFIQQRCDVDGF